MSTGVWKASFIFTACILASCDPAPSDRYELVIDPAFSAEEVASITEASHAWEAVLDARVKLTSAVGACRGDNHEICVHSATKSQIVALGIPSTIGFTNRSGISDRADVYLLVTDGVRAVAHELGHAMGLEHTQAGTLMCDDSGCAAFVPTCDDAAQWDAVRHGIVADRSCPKGGSFTYTGR